MTARLDRSTGRLEVSVALHRPFPLALDRSYWYSGITVSVNGAPSAAGDCRTGSDTVGATWLFIGPEQPTPTPELPGIDRATARVSYRQETTPMPLTFTGDRRTATVTVDDELLRGADLRCLSVYATGRAAYDPRQPDGGPASEGPFGRYFAASLPERSSDERCAGAPRAKSTTRIDAPLQTPRARTLRSCTVTGLESSSGHPRCAETGHSSRWQTRTYSSRDPRLTSTIASIKERPCPP